MKLTLKIITALIAGLLFGCICVVVAPIMFLIGAINGQWPWEM